MGNQQFQKTLLVQVVYSEGTEKQKWNDRKVTNDRNFLKMTKRRQEMIKNDLHCATWKNITYTVNKNNTYKMFI